MRTVSLVGVCVAMAIGTSSVAFAEMPNNSQPITSNARITTMQNKLDRFEARRDLERSRLYVSRDRTDMRVAQAEQSRSASRYNR